MTAFKCDICGAYYEPYCYFGNQEAHANTIVFCRKTAGIIANNITQTFDACPECIKAVDSLIAERKRDKKDDS